MIYDRQVVAYKTATNKYDYKTHHNIKGTDIALNKPIDCDVTTLGLIRTQQIMGSVAKTTYVIRTYQQLPHNFNYLMLDGDKRHFILQTDRVLKGSKFTYIVTQDVTTNE